jgi:hypothetical protein
MRECHHELYLAIYDAVRAGLAQGDGDIVRRVSIQIAGRDAKTTLVMMLGLIEAKRGDPARRKDEVCDDGGCSRCAKAQDG